MCGVGAECLPRLKPQVLCCASYARSPAPSFRRFLFFRPGPAFGSIQKYTQPSDCLILNSLPDDLAAAPSPLRTERIVSPSAGFSFPTCAALNWCMYPRYFLIVSAVFHVDPLGINSSKGTCSKSGNYPSFIGLPVPNRLAEPTIFYTQSTSRRPAGKSTRSERPSTVRRRQAMPHRIEIAPDP